MKNKVFKWTILFLIVAMVGILVWWLCNRGGDHQITLSPELTDAVERYDRVQPFSCGMAGVLKGDKYGYINEYGEEVIACNRKYYSDYCEEGEEFFVPYFSEGLAVCYHFSRDVDGWVDYSSLRYGYINTEGQEVIPCIYTWASPFSEGLARVIDGEQILFIDKKGKEMFRLDDDMMSFSDCHDGLIAVFEKESTATNGFIDMKGRVAIPLTYSSVSSFSEGLAYVEDDDFRGFIDTKGQQMFSCDDYDKVSGFHDGLAAVYQDMTVGFIDKTGSLVIPCKFEAQEGEDGAQPGLEDFRNGLCHIAAENCFIDGRGNRILTYEPTLSVSSFSEGLAVANVYGRLYGYMDKQGSLTFDHTEIRKIKTDIDEENRQIEEEYRRQQEEQRRLAEQGPDWIQGTWIYSAYGMVSHVTISGRYLMFDLDGDVQYNGTFEYYDGELHFGYNYIPVDEYAQRLKADGTHYFSRCY